MMGAAEEACDGGSPAFDWLGRLAWIGENVIEGKVAGF